MTACAFPSFISVPIFLLLSLSRFPIPAAPSSVLSLPSSSGSSRALQGCSQEPRWGGSKRKR